MTRSDQLRQALAQVDYSVGNEEYFDAVETIKDAARFALRVWEGEAIIIERDENGRWPKHVVEALADLSITSIASFRVQIRQNLDALASTQEQR